MATLTFNAKKVEKLVQHALAAVQHTRSYGQNNDPAPALHLVMDGMYLISNGEPYLPGSACGQSALNAVVYAEGYEPPNRLPQVGNELLTAARLVREEQVRGTVFQNRTVDSWAASVERLSPSDERSGVANHVA